MFVDEVDIQILAGDGGKGGSVFLVASPHHNTLVTYRFHPEFKAERGQHGQGSNRTGYDGSDLLLDVPPGTVAYEIGTDGDLIPLGDLTTPGEKILVARGGHGGRGKDDTLFAKITGIVKFTDHGAKGRKISIVPADLKN